MLHFPYVIHKTLIGTIGSELGDGLFRSVDLEEEMLSSKSSRWRCASGLSLKIDGDMNEPYDESGIKCRHPDGFISSSKELRLVVVWVRTPWDIVSSNWEAWTATTSKRLDRRFFWLRLFSLWKYFWAWLATWVGVLVLTKFLEIPRQSPFPSLASPAKKSLCSSSVHGTPFFLSGVLPIRPSERYPLDTLSVCSWSIETSDDDDEDADSEAGDKAT